MFFVHKGLRCYNISTKNADMILFIVSLCEIPSIVNGNQVANICVFCNAKVCAFLPGLWCFRKTCFKNYVGWEVVWWIVMTVWRMFNGKDWMWQFMWRDGLGFVPPIVVSGPFCVAIVSGTRKAKDPTLQLAVWWLLQWQHMTFLLLAISTLAHFCPLSFIHCLREFA